MIVNEDVNERIDKYLASITCNPMLFGSNEGQLKLLSRLGANYPRAQRKAQLDA